MIPRAPDHTSRLARGELSDPLLVESLEAEDRDSLLGRREFLARTAAAAGLAGASGLLPTETLVAEAARRAARSRPLPSPRDMPLDTIVVLMMENRSFDHYFGWHPNADGRNSGLGFPDLEGRVHRTHHLAPDFQGCDFRDPDHGWRGGRHQFNRGAMDGFFRGNEDGTGSDAFAIGYYLEDDLAFIPHVAAAFTLYDRWFCSIMASTFPNRHYQLGAQNGGQKSNEINVADPLRGWEWETICDRALARGLSVGYYVNDLPVPALYGLRGLEWVRPALRFHADALSGNLPNICFVDPPFLDGGGGNGISADDHPHGDIRLGQAYMSDIVHSFISGPQYRRGAMFINYDEWGGFFDHVRPRHVPDARREDWSLTGFRVPAVAISPYTRAKRPGGRVGHMTATHESILKLISYRFGLGYLTRRHRYASNIGRSFDFSKRDFEPPELPDPAAILALPCALGGSPRPKVHDLARLETTGVLDRLGYEVVRPTWESLFKQPDRVRRAYER